MGGHVIDRWKAANLLGSLTLSCITLIRPAHCAALPTTSKAVFGNGHHDAYGYRGVVRR